ncbi:MAG: dUTP diphosphatase [Selenomonadaceae bacterium]|nr:dUTP diphosphatase [Selenomonadaceae bacterium]
MDRGFEILKGYENSGIILPTRKTALSAGYDLQAAENVLVSNKKISLVPTGLKAFMLSDEVLMIYIRSGLAVKYGVTLANGVGVIDADYQDHIILPVVSFFGEFEIKKGMRIAQGIFQKYLTVDGDKIGIGAARAGRFGSTGEF